MEFTRPKNTLLALKFQQDSKKYRSECQQIYENVAKDKSEKKSSEKMKMKSNFQIIIIQATSSCRLRRKDSLFRITIAIVTSNKIYFSFRKCNYYYYHCFSFVKINISITYKTFDSARPQRRLDRKSKHACEINQHGGFIEHQHTWKQHTENEIAGIYTLITKFASFISAGRPF